MNCSDNLSVSGNYLFTIRDCVDIVSGGVQAAILFYPSWVIADMLSWKTNYLSFIFILAAAVFYGLAMLSRTWSHTLIKFGISVIAAIPVYQYFYMTNYTLRALNWVLPGYGKPSAGGGFASVILLMFLLIACFITTVLGIVFQQEIIDDSKFQRLIRLKTVICTIIMYRDHCSNIADGTTVSKVHVIGSIWLKLFDEMKSSA